MRRILLISLVALVFVPAVRADADPIPIVRYDISNALVSGSGNWFHVYTGTITPTTVPGVNFQVANYTGGGGTLNDGVIGADENTTQLFDVGAASVVTLYFGDFFRVNGISLFEGDITTNSIPGAINRTVTVAANGVSANIEAQAFGTVRSALGTPVNDRLSFTGSPLQGVLTDRLTLSGFRSSESLDRLIGSYSITEIRVDSSDGPVVPEPATLTLLGIGLAGVGYRRRRRHDRAPAATP